MKTETWNSKGWTQKGWVICQRNATSKPNAIVPIMNIATKRYETSWGFGELFKDYDVAVETMHQLNGHMGAGIYFIRPAVLKVGK